jgi:hypothetical protein
MLSASNVLLDCFSEDVSGFPDTSNLLSPLTEANPLPTTAVVAKFGRADKV